MWTVETSLANVTEEREALVRSHRTELLKTVSKLKKQHADVVEHLNQKLQWLVVEDKAISQLQSLVPHQEVGDYGY